MQGKNWNIFRSPEQKDLFDFSISSKKKPLDSSKRKKKSNISESKVSLFSSKQQNPQEEEDLFSKIFIKEINKTEDNTTAHNPASSYKKDEDFLYEMVCTLKEINEINKENLQINKKVLQILQQKQQFGESNLKPTRNHFCSVEQQFSETETMSTIKPIELSEKKAKALQRLYAKRQGLQRLSDNFSGYVIPERTFKSKSTTVKKRPKKNSNSINRNNSNSHARKNGSSFDRNSMECLHKMSNTINSSNGGVNSMSRRKKMTLKGKSALNQTSKKKVKSQSLIRCFA